MNAYFSFIFLFLSISLSALAGEYHAKINVDPFSIYDHFSIRISGDAAEAIYAGMKSIPAIELSPGILIRSGKAITCVYQREFECILHMGADGKISANSDEVMSDRDKTLIKCIDERSRGACAGNQVCGYQKCIASDGQGTADLDPSIQPKSNGNTEARARCFAACNGNSACIASWGCRDY